MFKMLSSPPWRKPRLSAAQVARAARQARNQRLASLLSAPSVAPEQRSPGCGWFDSSHDLSQGLQVGEADAGVFASLSIADWWRMDPCALHQNSTLA